jgi:hypothetical protein
MSMEPRWNDTDREKPEIRIKTCLSVPLSVKNSTRTDHGANPSLRGETPATNRLSHSTAILSTLNIVANNVGRVTTGTLLIIYWNGKCEKKHIIIFCFWNKGKYPFISWVKLSRSIIQALTEREVQLLLILELALGGLSGQRYAPAALYPGKKTPCTHWIGGWVGLRAGLNTEARGQILCFW